MFDRENGQEIFGRRAGVVMRSMNRDWGNAGRYMANDIRIMVRGEGKDRPGTRDRRIKKIIKARR